MVVSVLQVRKLLWVHVTWAVDWALDLGSLTPRPVREYAAFEACVT